MRAIAAHEPEIFINSRLGQEALRAANNDYPTAVEIAVERASGIIPTLSGIGVGLLGSLGVNPARLFGASTARGLALRILTPIGRAAQEGILEELPQSALEQFTQNLAVSQVNPEQDLLEGVPGAGLLGAITGAFGGGAFGTVEALAGGRGRDPLEEEYVANLEAERDRLEAGYDQAEAILGALAPLQQPEQPSEPVAPPSRAPTPTAPPDTSGLDEALFALESSLEDGTDVERRQATSDLVDAMLAAGAPPEQVTEALESEESLIALAEALAASNQVSVQPSPEDDATEERQQDGQRPNEDQQELSPRQSYYRDLDRLEQAYRAREDAVDANNRESYEEAHGHLVEAAREIFGEDYVSSYQAALGHDLETNEGQNMPRIEADLADAVEQHLRDNDRLQETTSDVEPEGGIVQPQQERLAHTQEVEGATPSPAPTPAEPPAAVEPPSTQDQLEELEAVKPPPEPAAVTPPEAAAEQPPGPPPTMAEIQQLTEIEEPGDFNVAVAAKGWDPASLKALRDSLPVPDPNDLGEQANLYRTLGDAIQAARQAQKAKGRSTSAPRPRTTRGENDKGTEAPAVQSQSKPSGPKVKEVSQESLKRLQKALSDLETGGTQKIARYDEQGNKLGGAKIRVSGGAKDYHPTALRALENAVNNAKEELEESRIGPATRTPSQFKTRAEWLIAEAERLTHRASGPPRQQPVQFPEDRIADALADKNLAKASKLRGEASAGEVEGVNRSTEVFGESRQRVLPVKGKAAERGTGGKTSRPRATPADQAAAEAGGGQAGPAGEQAPSKAEPTPAQEEQTEKLTEGEPAPELTEESLIERLQTAIDGINASAPRPSEDFDTPTPSDLRLIDVMANVAKTKRGKPYKDAKVRAQHQAMKAVEISTKRDGRINFDRLIDALNAIEGVFERVRAAQFVAPYVSEDERAEMRERLHGYHAVDEYLKQSGDTLFGGLYASKRKIKVPQLPLEILNLRRQNTGLFRGNWMSPARSGIKPISTRRRAYRFIKDALIPALNQRRVDALRNTNRSAKRKRADDIAYYEILGAITAHINNDLTHEMRAELLNRQNGWLQEQVEIGAIEASTAEDIFHNAASGLYIGGDARQYTGRDNGPPPQYTYAWQERKNQLAKRLNQYMRQMGFGDLVGRIVDVVRNPDNMHPVETASGSYWAKFMAIAMGGDDYTGNRSLNDMSLDEAWQYVMSRADHELVHAARHMGLIKDSEWEVLQAFVRNYGLDERGRLVRVTRHADSLRGQILADPLYQNQLFKFPPSERHIIADEEAVAIAMQNFKTAAPSRGKGVLARIGRIIRAIMRALRMADIRNAEQIYKNAEDIIGYMMDGKVGARPRNYYKGLGDSATAVVERLKIASGGPFMFRGMFGRRRFNITDPRSYEKPIGEKERENPKVPTGRYNLMLGEILNSLNRPQRELLAWAEIYIAIEGQIKDLMAEDGLLVSEDKANKYQVLQMALGDAQQEANRIIDVLGDEFWDNAYLVAFYTAIKAYGRPVSELTAEELNLALDWAEKPPPEDNPPSQLYMFAGSKARTANLKRMQEAARGLSSGMSEEEIWRLFGWFKDKDGKWRWEIDDSKAKLRFGTKHWAVQHFSKEDGGGIYQEDFNGRLQDVLRHNELFAAYPWLRNIQLHIGIGEYYSMSGSNTGDGGIDIMAGTREEALNVLLHELQHVIQHTEGFASGGSPISLAQQNKRYLLALEEALETAGPNIAPVILSAIAKLEAATTALTPGFLGPEVTSLEAYKRLGGEAEARLTQHRQNLTAEQRRAALPTRFLDVPEQERIHHAGPVEIAFEPETERRITSIVDEVNNEFNAKKPPDLKVQDIGHFEVLMSVAERGVVGPLKAHRANALRGRLREEFQEPRRRLYEIFKRLRAAGIESIDVTYANMVLDEFLESQVRSIVGEDVNIPTEETVMRRDRRVQERMARAVGARDYMAREVKQLEARFSRFVNRGWDNPAEMQDDVARAWDKHRNAIDWADYNEYSNQFHMHRAHNTMWLSEAAYLKDRGFEDWDFSTELDSLNRIGVAAETARIAQRQLDAMNRDIKYAASEDPWALFNQKPPSQYMRKSIRRLIDEVKAIADANNGQKPRGWYQIVANKTHYTPNAVTALWREILRGVHGEDFAEEARAIAPARRGRPPDQLYASRRRPGAPWDPKLFGQLPTMRGQLPGRQYEINPLQLYSQAEKAASEFPEERSTKQHMRRWLERRVKKVELDWIGIDELLSGRGTDKVTKQELLDFIRSRKLNMTVSYYYGSQTDPAARFAGFTADVQNWPDERNFSHSMPIAHWANYTLLGNDVLDHNYIEVAAKVMPGQPGSEGHYSHVGGPGTMWAFLASDMPIRIGDEELNAFMLHQGQSDYHDAEPEAYTDLATRVQRLQAAEDAKLRDRMALWKAFGAPGVERHEDFTKHGITLYTAAAVDLWKINLPMVGSRSERTIHSIPNVDHVSSWRDFEIALGDPDITSLIEAIANEEMDAYAKRVLGYTHQEKRAEFGERPYDELTQEQRDQLYAQDDLIFGEPNGEDISTMLNDPTPDGGLAEYFDDIDNLARNASQPFKDMLGRIRKRVMKAPTSYFLDLSKLGAWEDAKPLLQLAHKARASAEEYNKLRNALQEPRDIRAPFRFTWPEAMFRHAFMMALSGGHDALAWSSGDAVRTIHSNYQGDFYDKRLPAYARKWLSRYGAKVETVDIGGTTSVDPSDDLVEEPNWEQTFDFRLADELEELEASIAATSEIPEDTDVSSLLETRFRESLLRHNRIIDEQAPLVAIRKLRGKLNDDIRSILENQEDDDTYAHRFTEDELTRLADEYARGFVDRYNTVRDQIAEEREDWQDAGPDTGRRPTPQRHLVYVMRITPQMREHFLDTGAHLMASRRRPHTVTPGGGLTLAQRASDIASLATGVQPPTVAGFSAARRPGATFLGEDPRARAREVLSLTRKYGTPTHWSKRTANQMVSYLTRVGRNLERANPSVSIKHIIGRGIKQFAYGLTTLGNLPGQGYYLTLRSKLMGDINAGIDHAERLNKLSERMSDTDYEQFNEYMLTRDADPNKIRNETVRTAAVLSKELLNAFGAENVNIGRMDERQYEKYRDRYLPRKYFRYIENSLRTTGIRLGKQGYLRERLPGQDRQIFGALDMAGLTEAVETLREKLTKQMEMVSDRDRSRVGMYLAHKLSTPRTINDTALRNSLPGLRAELDRMQAHVDSLDLITLSPAFPRGYKSAAPGTVPYGPYPMKKRYGEHYLARAFFRAAKRDSSIGRVLEQSAVDAQITDPVVLSAAAIVEQNRDLAVYHFFRTLEVFQTEWEKLNPRAPPISWIKPDQMVVWNGRTMTVDALQATLDVAQKNFHLNQNPLMRTYAERQIAEMQAIIDANRIDDDAIGDDYIRLPNTAAYGDLRSLIIHRAIFQDLKGTLGITTMTLNPVAAWMVKQWGGFMSFFKQAMTTLNIPKGHTRALFQNVATSYFSGVGGHDVGLFVPSFNVQTWLWYFKALGYMQNNAEIWKLAQDLGVRTGTFTTTELRHAYGLVRKLKIQERMASGDWAVRTQAVFDFIDGAKGLAADMFNFWDTWARFTKFVHEIENNKARPGDAMIEANEWAPDYSLVPDWVRALRTTAIPFLTYRYKLTPKFIDQFSRLLGHVQRGEVLKAGDVALRFAAPMMLWTGVTSFAMASMLGMDDDEHRALRQAMTRYFRNNPGAVPLPWRDSQGNIVIVDIGIMFPWTQTVQSAQSLARGEIQEAAMQLGVGIPAADVWAAWQTGVDPYTGFPLYPETATESEKNIAHFAFLMNYLTPPPLRGLIDPMVGALTGQRIQLGGGEVARTLDYFVGDGLSISGKPIEDPEYLAARYISGFNFNAFDPLDQIDRNLRQMNHELNEIERQRRTAIRDYGNRARMLRQRRGISAASLANKLEERRRQHLQTMENLNERRNRVRRELQEYRTAVRPIQRFEREQEAQ